MNVGLLIIAVCALDWDMYFLSLMAGTGPAANDSAAFDIAISNIIGVTQTRSAYGKCSRMQLPGPNCFVRRAGDE